MNDHDLQQLLDEAAAQLGVVGAQLAVYESGRQRELATGFRHRELDLPVTTDTLFQIGSTTKVFNAALVMSLVDDGKLDLDVPVGEYIANFRLSDGEAQQNITLRHLLSMSAGLDNGTYHDYGRGDDALGRYVEALAGIPQIFTPGLAFGYSNAATNVAGHAAARVVGRSWEALLAERIFIPLGLKRCALLAEDLLQHPVALGYDRSMQRTALGMKRSLGPAGALTYCSAGDLVRFARMFLDGGKSVEGAQVLSTNAIETMQRPQIKLPTRFLAEEWCAGPYRKQWGGRVICGHSGTNCSGSSTLLWCPEKNVAIAIVVNVAELGYPFSDAIFDEVFPRLFGIEKPVAPSPANVTFAQMDLLPYIGRFEAFGMTYRFVIEGKILWMDVIAGQTAGTRCELIPLGDGRFLPCDLRISGHRNWDIAFWGRDADGRATHLLQGVFPLRRTG